MSDLVFGIIWLTFSILMSIPFYISVGAAGASEMIFMLFLFFSIFYAVGLWILIRGIKRVTKDKATDRMGAVTVGKVLRIGKTGTYVNGNPELKAEIASYDTQTMRIKAYVEVIGFAPAKYRPGQYLRVKVYEDDLNILGEIDENEVSIKDKEIIDRAFPTPEDEKVVYINGVKYVQEGYNKQEYQYPEESPFDSDKW
jgi:hypothetical protein